MDFLVCTMNLSASFNSLHTCTMRMLEMIFVHYGERIGLLAWSASSQDVDDDAFRSSMVRQ